MTDALAANVPSAGPEHESRVDELVTVVIPARDEVRTIETVLSSVLSQTYQNLQVIVVDGMSTDGTTQLVQRICNRDRRVELILNPDQVIPLALNLGVDHARGKWIVRVDAHSRIPYDYVERVVTHLRTGNWGGVGGRKDAVGHTPTGRAIAAVLGSKFAQGNSIYHYGTTTQTVDHIPFGAYPLEVIRELGGWSEVQLVNEDFEFDYRVRQSGRELLFDPQIRIDWDCRQRIGDLFHQYRRYGSGKVQTLRTHPESISARNVAAPALVAGLGVATAMLPWRRTRRLAVSGMVPYAGLLVAATFATVPKVDSLQEKARVLPAFAAVHIGWGLGFWEELINGRRRRGHARPHLASSRGQARG